MFMNTLSIENKKIFKRRMLWIELGILAALIIFLYTIIYATMQTSSEMGMESEARQAGARYYHLAWSNFECSELWWRK